MSSHHIVRDKQEPALLIIDDLILSDEEKFGQLLEWSPTIIATDESYESLQASQIKVDYIFTKKDDFITQEESIKIIYSKNYINDVLNFLEKHAYFALNILISKEKIPSNFNYNQTINIVFYTSNQKIYLIKNNFSKWLANGSQIEIITSYISTYGLTQINKSVFKKDDDGFFQVQFQNGQGLIAEFI